MSETKQVLTYADVGFGDELPEFIPDVSMAMIQRFGATTGMTYWRFTDHERARAAQHSHTYQPVKNAYERNICYQRPTRARANSHIHILMPSSFIKLK